MRSYLDANPENAAVVALHRQAGQMVPVARFGMMVGLVNRRRLDTLPLAEPLPVADYVAGLELLGFTFALWTAFDGAPERVLRGEPAETLPPGWDRQALRIMDAFGNGRGSEVVVFLQARDPSASTPSPSSTAVQENADVA